MNRGKSVYLTAAAIAALALLCLVGCRNPSHSSSSDDVPVTGLSLNPAACTMAVGTSYQISAAVSPPNATDTAITWTSSNPAVASVSSAGLVTAGVTGTTTITATSADGSKSASCALTVTTFFAGYYVDGSKCVPCYWEGTSLHSLGDGTHDAEIVNSCPF